jgi:DNA polymerase V
MEEDFYGASYKGSKDFTQHNVKTANATGFGAAADDYAERGIDLNEELVRNKPATFFLRMRGKAMEADGIYEGDVLVIDKSIEAVHNKVIIAAINGEMLVRRLQIKDGKTLLVGSKKSVSQDVTNEADYKVWGVVTYIIHKVK